MDIGAPRRQYDDEQMHLPEVEKEIPRIKCSICCAVRTSMYLGGCITFMAFPINVLSLSENAPYFGYNITRERHNFRLGKLIADAAKGGMGWGSSKTVASARRDRETAAERKFRTRHLGMLAPDYSSAAAPEASTIMEHSKAIYAKAPQVVTKVTPSSPNTAPSSSSTARQNELSRTASLEGRRSVPSALVYKQRAQDYLRQGRYLRYTINLCDRFMYQAIPISAVAFTHQILVSELMWSKSERPLFEVNTISMAVNLVGWVAGIAGCTLIYRRVLPKYNPAFRLAVSEMLRYKRVTSRLPYLVGSLRESFGLVEAIWALAAYTGLYMIVTGVTEYILGSQYAMAFEERGDTDYVKLPSDAAAAESACGDSPIGERRQAPVGCIQKWMMHPLVWYYADWSSLCSPRWREWREVQLLRRRATGGGPQGHILDEAHTETIGSRGRLFKKTRVV